MKIIFATNNAHKVREIQKICPSDLTIISLAEAGITQDIPEPYDTLEANAIEKTRVIYELTGLDCIAEDTGLEVTALDNAPGVRSARYAGEQRNDKDNMAKLLSELNHFEDRTAQFRTVICYCKGGENYLFEGICAGKIGLQPDGDNGFGYDPVFIPNGYEQSFGRLNDEIKLIESHRSQAFAKFRLHLLNA